MKHNNRNTDAFYALLRAGLWEQKVQLSAFEPIDFAEVARLAEEQSVVGLVAAGLEHAEDYKVKKQEIIPFLTKVLRTEE